MKGGLGDTSLAQPEVALARQQPIAEKRPQLVVQRALAVVARVVLQDMTNILRVRDEVAASRTDLEVGDVTESQSGLHEDADRIASDGREHPEDRYPAGAWRTHGRGADRFHPQDDYNRRLEDWPVSASPEDQLVVALLPVGWFVAGPTRLRRLPPA